jgi:hypothetical protein
MFRISRGFVEIPIDLIEEFDGGHKDPFTFLAQRK